ncbi:hypothetical protein [Pontivivens ytuae]|uniref:Uncharacterized protein n=1 Tax=Pontivivens ytuae TaxID=2789856 RepID=A0A7S9LVQ6_9RHOB|nr:hypothetical protein [Pontivivens ytuae]QPH55590.1 hypothetical protein I0K15_07615 [Pontivivens ytuae]
MSGLLKIVVFLTLSSALVAFWFFAMFPIVLYDYPYLTWGLLVALILSIAIIVIFQSYRLYVLTAVLCCIYFIYKMHQRSGISFLMEEWLYIVFIVLLPLFYGVFYVGRTLPKPPPRH